MNSPTPTTYFEALNSKGGINAYTAEERNVVLGIVRDLADHPGVQGQPGLILGRVQSGKTKCFIGVIAQSFDEGTDVAVVLTKATKALVNQTEARLKRSFEGLPDELPVMAFDVIKTTNLTARESSGKVILIAKKETNNLERLEELISTDLKGKRVLVIDDEADFASLGWRKKKKEPLKQASIPNLIDAVRKAAPEVRYLQVTATPFSLYLQPDAYTTDPAGMAVLPKKPVFTAVLEPHAAYVGGDDYFGDHGEDDPRGYLFVPVDQAEQDRLRKKDKKLLSIDALTAPEIDGLRKAVVTFIVAGSIRHLQDPRPKGRELQFSMLIHNDVANDAQDWQRELVQLLLTDLKSAASRDAPQLAALVSTAFNNLESSIEAAGGTLPTESDVQAKVRASLDAGYVMPVVVNSTNKDQLLDEVTGALKMRAEFNIFLGGNMLDRGITVPNMISFYYGRRPVVMQADTVLQHFRMFGPRPKEDMQVTRLFTAVGVYDRMKAIHDLDNGLRMAFKHDVNGDKVAFLQSTKKNGIRFCAPNKIRLTETKTISPGRTLAPTSIQIRDLEAVTPVTAAIDAIVNKDGLLNSFVAWDRESAFEVIDLVSRTMDFVGRPLDWQAMKSLIKYYLDVDQAPGLLATASVDRNLAWETTLGKTGLSLLGETLRKKVESRAGSSPVFVLLKQNGEVGAGWKGAPFWWPVLYASPNASPCVYAEGAPKAR